jgi:hypothetical protein
MNARHLALAVCLVVPIGFLGVPVKSIAEPVEYKFEGTVTSVDQLFPAGAFSVGDPVSGTFVFDPSLSTGDNYPDPSFASYPVIEGLRYFSVGPHNYWAYDQFDGVSIYNDFTDHLGSTFDLFELVIGPIDGPTFWSDTSYFLLEPWILYIDLFDSTLSVFSSDALPAEIPEISNFDTKVGYLTYRDWDDLYCPGTCNVEFVVTRLSSITVEELLIELVDLVTELNIRNGIATSLDAKLTTALGAIDDLNSNNDTAAIGSLNAFISAVEAQRGKELTDDEADMLIEKANEIIARIIG